MPEPMHPWIGRALVFIALAVMIVIRAPFARRAKAAQVADNRGGALEIALLSLVSVGSLILPVVAAASSLLALAEYPLRLPALLAGVIAEVVGLWLFYRSHRDLGRNWSPTLQIREQHGLVTGGVYAHVRHPMYSSMFLIASGQALLFPNWIAGPAGLIAFALMFALRLGPEERMMLATFGDEYERYRHRSKRLIPGVW